jgi:hypothetical protein
VAAITDLDGPVLAAQLIGQFPMTPRLVAITANSGAGTSRAIMSTLWSAKRRRVGAILAEAGFSRRRAVSQFVAF